MGIKSGRFTGRNGHEYEVALVGATVATATIDLGIPPATISMAAGEHKFCGFKSTTATVNILTDAPLIELYSAGVTDIRLTITDATDGKVEFDGYVIPFAFDQPYTGKNDSVTVNAVDLLTARKNVKYQSGTGDGTDMYAHDIIGDIAHRAGITELVINLNFNGTEDTMYTDSPLNVKVAQAGFLQDEVSELDAMSAICKFFGYTGCIVGRTLYLYDEHCLVNAPVGKRYNANVYRRNDDGKWTVYRHYYNQGSPIIDQYVDGDTICNDINVTIERAYDGIQITPEGSDTSVLLPDVCADENMEENDNSLGTSTRTVQDYVKDGDNVEVDYIQWRTPMKSKLLNTGISVNGQVTDGWGTVSGDPLSGGATNWTDGAIPMRLVHAPRTRSEVAGENVISPIISYEKNVIWLRSSYNMKEISVAATQKDSKRYSHTNGLVKLNIEWFATASANWANIDDKAINEDIGFIAFVAIVNGKEHFVSDYKSGALPVWTEDKASAFFLTKSDKLIQTMASINRYTSDVIVAIPNDGQVYVELAWSIPTNFIYDPINIYIESLSIEGYGDSINLDDRDFLHKYSEGEELLEVRTMLTTRMSGYLGSPYEGKNARPSVVTDTAWKGGYMGRGNSESIPISGILMEQLKARYAQPRICYKMTVEKNINPYAAVYFGGRGYTVEAYDKDLYNSTTTITID